jgi:alpha-galactosidase
MGMAKFPSRRGVLKGAAAVLLARAATAAPESNTLNPASIPTSAWLFTESAVRSLTRNGNHWQAGDIDLITEGTGHGLSLVLHTPTENPVRLHLRWSMPVSTGFRFLGDAWERSYGDLDFRAMEPERILPWYVIATDGRSTHAFGVKTGAAALCFWQIDPEGISLWCDLRNGGRAVELGSRQITIAEIVSQAYSDQKPFKAAERFCGLMSPNRRLPKLPIYGGNNWYYAYGNSSASDILADSERIASVSDSTSNRPWMVIDDGWSVNATAGPWRAGNSKFPDMPKLASDMLKTGVRPGLWTRPLFTKEEVPEACRLASPNAQLEYKNRQEFTLDPTDAQAAAIMQEDLRTVISWGYQLVKHDFSTYDLLGRWGFQMNAQITDSNWSFRDRTRTNAEIVRDFYTLLRSAAGETPLLGCNTIGHLSAGLFEAQRIGDDTSGRDWSRTRKMGVNTLAFRMPQHNKFFAVDADCVGLTKQIDWKFNRQWLDLLAGSGTPLFVSIAPDALRAEQRKALKEAFAIASQVQAVAEPLDWVSNSEPQQWLVRGKRVSYDWFGGGGGWPFGG